jgi:hypothetical protein
VKAVIVMTKCFSNSEPVRNSDSLYSPPSKKKHEELCQNCVLFESRHFKARFRNVTCFTEAHYGNILFGIEHCRLGEFKLYKVFLSPHASLSPAKDI